MKQNRSQIQAENEALVADDPVTADREQVWSIRRVKNSHGAVGWREKADPYQKCRSTKR